MSRPDNKTAITSFHTPAVTLIRFLYNSNSAIELLQRIYDFLMSNIQKFYVLQAADWVMAGAAAWVRREVCARCENEKAPARRLCSREEKIFVCSNSLLCVRVLLAAMCCERWLIGRLYLHLPALLNMTHATVGKYPACARSSPSGSNPKRTLGWRQQPHWEGLLRWVVVKSVSPATLHSLAEGQIPLTFSN